MKLDKTILKPILSYGLDYVRWTQLTPMILVWGIVLLLFFAMVFVNFQHQSDAALETLLNSIYQLPFIGESVKQYLATENNSYQITTVKVKSWILTIWSITSLLFMFISLLLSYRRKPDNPRTLKHKIKIIFLVVLLLFVGFMANYYANPIIFKGDSAGWILNFSLISLLVFMVSSYSLTISHFLNYLNYQIFKE